MEADANEKELIDHINETYNLSPEYIFKNFLIIRIQTSKKQKMVWGPDVCSRRKNL